jgi:hypothetical protein
VLPLLLALGSLFLLGQQLAVVGDAGIHIIGRVRHNELIRFGRVFAGFGRILQSSKPGLEFGIGFNNYLQNFPQVSFAVVEGVNVVVKFVVNIHEIL